VKSIATIFVCVVFLLVLGLGFFFVLRTINQSQLQIQQMEKSWRSSNTATMDALQHWNGLQEEYIGQERIINTAKGECLDKKINPAILKVLVDSEEARAGR
jgi:predicted PurR-regulated permease PerM